MTSNEDFQLPPTFIEQMDRARFDAEQKEKLAKIEAERSKAVEKQRTKQSRKDAWITLAWAIPAAAVLATIVYAIGIHEGPPPSPEDYKNSESYRESQCYAHGGGWVTGELLYTQPKHGLCVYPGRQVEGAPTS